MRFAKMQGVGNDFVVVNAAALFPHPDLPALARTLCERRFGPGADGLLVLTRGEEGPAETHLLASPHSSASQVPPEAGGLRDSPTPPFRGAGGYSPVFTFQMFNPDGSEDMCGNGLRCAGLYAHRAGWTDRQMAFTVSTKDGPRTLRLLSVHDDNTEAALSVDMGRPKFAPADVPFTGESAGGRVVEVPLLVDGTSLRVTAVNTGSTHTVLWSETDVDEDSFTRLSPLLENSPLFPERTSVLWAAVTGANDVNIRIWERGAGETLGCGTGACAVAVAARVQGKVGDGPVRVTSRGGTLTIDWPGGDADITMTGPAVLVYEGNI